MPQGLFAQQYSLYYQRANMLYQRPEIKASLEIILSVFTVTILIFFAIRPTITNIFALQKKIEDQTVLEKKADNKISQLLAATKAINDYGDQLNLYATVVPGSYSYFEYSKRMAILASDDNVTLSVLSMPGGWMVGDKAVAGLDKEKVKKYISTDSTGITTMSVSFSIIGSQKDTIQFLSDLENMDRLSLVKSVSFTKVPKSEAQPVPALRTDAKVDFYSFVKP